MDTCIVDGCNRTNGPEDMEVFHKGESLGFICAAHIGTSKALKLIVSKKKTGDFRLIEAADIPGPLD